jgi:hypothetical protein
VFAVLQLRHLKVPKLCRRLVYMSCTFVVGLLFARCCKCSSVCCLHNSMTKSYTNGMFKTIRIPSQSRSYSTTGTQLVCLSWPQHQIFLSGASDHNSLPDLGVSSSVERMGEYQVQVTLKLTVYPSWHRNSLIINLNYELFIA